MPSDVIDSIATILGGHCIECYRPCIIIGSFLFHCKFTLFMSSGNQSVNLLHPVPL
jgi:hypothetical protein